MSGRLSRLVDRLIRRWPFLETPLAAWLALAGYAGLIYFLSSRQFGPILAGLPPHSDKLIHMIEYAVLGMLTYHAVGTAGWAPKGAWRIVLVIVIGIAYGASDEFHQSFVPTRSPDVHDVMADAAGTAIGAWLLSRVNRNRVASHGTTSRQSIEK